jgi:putative transposase
MPRGPRIALGGYCYHALNRGNRRGKLFLDVEDYRAFMGLLATATERWAMRLLAYCLMPNHWHLVLWPRVDGELSAYIGWISNSHVCHHHQRHGTRGLGHIYQGRFKSCLIQNSAYLWNTLRYVEANALRAGLVARAEDWPWSSAAQPVAAEAPLVAESPVPRPSNWLQWVNTVPPRYELEALQTSARRGRPYGDATWTDQMIARHNLRYTARSGGRPRKDR